MLGPVLLDPVPQRSGLHIDRLRDMSDRSVRGEEELDGIILELLGVLLPAGGHDCECSLEPVSLNHTAAGSPEPGMLGCATLGVALRIAQEPADCTDAIGFVLR